MGKLQIHDQEKKVYGPDHYNDFVLDFIERHQDESFMVYYPMALVHAPFVTPPALTELLTASTQKVGSTKTAIMVKWLIATTWLAKYRQAQGLEYR